MVADHPVLLASDTVHRPLVPSMTMVLDQNRDGTRRGGVATRIGGRGFRRAEPGPHGPLVLEVRPRGEATDLQVWGAQATPAEVGQRHLHLARRWAGLDDDLTGFAELADSHPVLRRVRRSLSPPVIGAFPRAAESFGRAVLGQLVQGVEARRSTAQLVALLGTPGPWGLWAWPTRQALGETPAHVLRRCGISARSAGSLHAFCIEEAHVQRLAQACAWQAMDEALVHLPGVAGWTSAETRLYLGDADAVSVGDYHIPAQIGWALGERSEDDATMLELLAPYRPHRGRVIKLIERAAARGLVATRPRRGPRAALSAHRYW